MSKSKRSGKPPPGARDSQARWFGGIKAKWHGSRVEEAAFEEQEEITSARDASNADYGHDSNVQVSTALATAIDKLAHPFSDLRFDAETAEQSNRASSNFSRPTQSNFIVKENGKTAKTRGTKFRGAEIRRGMLKVKLKQGAIIRHFELEACTDPTAVADGVEIFDGPQESGLRFYRKLRYFIVTGVYEQHWTEVPIYTYRNRGLEGKPEGLKAEHVSIRASNIEKKTFNSQSRHPHLKVAVWNGGAPQLKPSSVVHFTKDKSSHAETQIEILGSIDASSLDRLQNLCKEF
ncbi:unnamed protein product [Zymoseptoria tritici ST99CH_1A5]|uniref:DUF6590 domain-containing protein n=4 Tax=Zymoseptoria tritici TaxID=1047171 RepID=F9X9K2_ZYMTI|nr:uncharacterized protein MYCGRDRAFT_92520 [Zymoseptoria tritici IPO323]SMQ49871.1 unnamed protein product [Zymoseptoria tritici ST99CH_3D7]SMR50860.1 unnamed protein product [Zymoseptoria tritici ST99CH_1E4]SMR51795.1 unnamed protein product [Zymoseptoria tritici ST99CH_3D1]SMY23556.1 unnamed protein product [Zymoseptoria tritici ST99CH_1A5]EGP87942.1 hypothetical protein MYCGRDRAFT_92520 [Zymoseptoria tritici IPO323]